MAALPLSTSPERVQTLVQSPGMSVSPSPTEQPQLPPLPPAFASSAPVSRVSSASPPLAASAPYATVTSTTFGTLDNPLIPKKRRRTTPAELAILEHEFRVNARPDPLERARIAERLGMTARAVQVWYQNRRQKEKKESSCSSSIASTGSDPRDLDGVVLSFSSSPLPSPALPLHPTTGAVFPHVDALAAKGGLQSSRELYTTGVTPPSSSSTGSNKENSYFPPMPSSTMPLSSSGRVTAPALLAASSSATRPVASAGHAPASAGPAAQQPYRYSYPSAPAPSSSAGSSGADPSSQDGLSSSAGVYLHRPHNASIIAAKKHVRKRPQGSHAPLARVPSLPHAFVFPPSPPKPASSAAAGAKPPLGRKASLNDVVARQQKKAAATVGLFGHAQGQTVAGAAERRRSSTPSGAAESTTTAVSPPPASKSAFAPDELAPFAQSQPSSMAALTPMSKAKVKDDLLRHMESDPPSASSPIAPLTRRRVAAHEASFGAAEEDEEVDELDKELTRVEDDEAHFQSQRPQPTRSLSSSYLSGGTSAFAPRGSAPSNRAVSLGAYHPHSRSSTASAALGFSAAALADHSSSVFDPSRAGAGRSCAVAALGRKRARILENQASVAPVPLPPSALPTRPPSTRPSTSAYASTAKAGSRGALGFSLDSARRESSSSTSSSRSKRRRVSGESTASAASAFAETVDEDDDDGSMAELSFSSTSTASTVDSLVTVASSVAPSSAAAGYFALSAAAKHASGQDGGAVKSQEDEQRECAELLLGLGGFC
ncbi:homeobox domain-containing protein [Rhodotorula paludigena]|uniref:homeobox domain-containing protein n=1 Tax=Rhodotorula paludigena TaxID=86838 RepID=UPI0031700BCD